MGRTAAALRVTLLALALTHTDVEQPAGHDVYRPYRTAGRPAGR